MADETTLKDLGALVRDVVSEAGILYDALVQVFALAINPLPVSGRDVAFKELTDTIPPLIRSIVLNLGYLFRHTVGNRALELAPLAKQLLPTLTTP